MSFESDLKRMEEITQLLKNPETGLAKELSRTLDQIQRKVEKVTSIDENELETVELDDEGNEEKDVF